MTDDYYAILGVDATATQDEIRSAYRRRARECHPDRHGTGPGPFQKLQEAYTVLGDPRQRSIYDRERRPEVRSPRRKANVRRYHAPVEPLIPDEPGPFGAGPAFGQPLGAPGSHTKSAGYERRRGRAAHAQPRAADTGGVLVEVELSPAEAAAGGYVRLRVPASVVCPRCHGRGRTGLWRCGRCGGAGWLVAETAVEVPYPPGTMKDHAVRVPVERPGAADLCLTVVFRPASRWL